MRTAVEVIQRGLPASFQDSKFQVRGEIVDESVWPDIQVERERFDVFHRIIIKELLLHGKPFTTRIVLGGKQINTRWTVTPSSLG